MVVGRPHPPRVARPGRGAATGPDTPGGRQGAPPGVDQALR